MDKAVDTVTTMTIRAMDNVMISATTMIAVVIELMAKEIRDTMKMIVTTTVTVDMVAAAIVDAVITTTVDSSMMMVIINLDTHTEHPGSRANRMLTVQDRMDLLRIICKKPPMNYCKS